jgi:hypothetical protein
LLVLAKTTVSEPVFSATALSVEAITSARWCSSEGLATVTTLEAPSFAAAAPSAPTSEASTATMTSPPCFAVIALPAAIATPVAFGMLPCACSP